MKSDYLKVVGLLLILFLIVNLVLFALKIINEIFFWAVIIAGAVFAYKVLPRLKSK